jgi:hypothetical protein
MSLILGAVGAVSVLLVTVGIFYVLIKLGRFLDAMKDKASGCEVSDFSFPFALIEGWRHSLLGLD